MHQRAGAVKALFALRQRDGYSLNATAAESSDRGRKLVRLRRLCHERKRGSHCGCNSGREQKAASVKHE
jgi:hypothetical protein